MKKQPLLLLLLVLSPAVWALDLGVNITETPIGIFGQNTTYIESIKARGWLTQSVFGTDLRVEGDVSYSNSYADGAWGPGTITYDLVEASLRGTSAGGESGVTEWDLGRRSVTDSTGGWIISSRWDGAGWSWLAGRTKIALSTGYSGLLLKKGSKISASLADEADLSDPDVMLAPRRVYGALGLAFNEALLRQDLQLELLGDYDFRGGSAAVHGAYATLSTTGPLPLGWRQRLFGTASYRLTSDTRTWGYVAGVEWSATLPFLGSRLVISGVGAQGFDGFGFRALSGKSLTEVVDLPASRAASAGIDFSFKPLPKTTLGLKSAALFRTSLDPVQVSGFSPESGAYWLGAEAGAYGSWTPTSDLTFATTGGVYVPPTGTMTVQAVVTATLKL